MSDNNSQLATRRDLKSVLAMPAIRGRFNEVLRGNSASFVANILNATVANPKLNECDPISVINAALTAATLNLSINPALGQAAIVPFKDKATLIVQVKGLVQLAHQTNKYRDINAFKIYEGEGWTEDRLTGRLTLTGHRTGDKIIAWGAYFRLANGFEKWMVMSIEEIEAHARKFSRAWNHKEKRFMYGGWVDNYDAMCRKTPMRLLILNYGPMTPEMQDLLAKEEEAGGEVDGQLISSELIERAEREEAEPAQVKTEQQTMAELGY